MGGRKPGHTGIRAQGHGEHGRGQPVHQHRVRAISKGTNPGYAESPPGLKGAEVKGVI